MQYLWKLEKAYMKDIINEYSDPRPATTTTATLLKRIKDKGFIDYVTIGKARQYFPLISKADYFGKHFRGMIQNFFGNSAATFASFFTQATDLSKVELEDLKKIIDQEIKKKNK